MDWLHIARLIVGIFISIAIGMKYDPLVAVAFFWIVLMLDIVHQAVSLVFHAVMSYRE